jgi:hypothetical protein
MFEATLAFQKFHFPRGKMNSVCKCPEKGETLMHARVITATVEPGRLDEVVDALQETVLNKIKHRQGFKNAFVLTDPSNNKVMAIFLVLDSCSFSEIYS